LPVTFTGPVLSVNPHLLKTTKFHGQLELGVVNGIRRRCIAPVGTQGLTGAETFGPAHAGISSGIHQLPFIAIGTGIATGYRGRCRVVAVIGIPGTGTTGHPAQIGTVVVLINKTADAPVVISLMRTPATFGFLIAQVQPGILTGSGDGRSQYQLIRFGRVIGKTLRCIELTAREFTGAIAKTFRPGAFAGGYKPFNVVAGNTTAGKRRLFNRTTTGVPLAIGTNTGTIAVKAVARLTGFPPGKAQTVGNPLRFQRGIGKVNPYRLSSDIRQQLIHFIRGTRHSK